MAASVIPPLPLTAQTRSAPPRPASFTVVEASIADMRNALEQKRTTSREIVQQYLTRIAIYEDRLNAVITVNPRALAIADSLDRERARGRIRGPLHGIPVALKDNIHTTDMPTTGGALAFADLVPPYEATLTKNLRGRRRDHHRQDAAHRARELGRERHAGQLQRAHRLRHEPVGPAARPAREQLRRPPGARAPAAPARASART